MASARAAVTEEEEEEEEKIPWSKSFQPFERFGRAQAHLPEKFEEPVAMIQINTHGQIEFIDDDPRKPKQFIIPQGIDVIFVSAVVPTITNFRYDDQVEEVTFLISNEFVESKEALQGKIDAEGDPAVIMKEWSDYVAGKIKKDIIPVTEAQMRLEIKDKISRGEDVTSEIAFVDNLDKSYEVRLLRPGEKMLDKMYCRNLSEGKSTSVGDMQLQALTSPYHPDIFELLEQKERDRIRRRDRSRERDEEREESTTASRTRNAESVTYLSKIVEFFNKEGTKVVVIFDNSCFTANDSSREAICASRREERHLRRELTSQLRATGKGGTRKRMRKQHKKTKHNKRSKKHIKHKNRKTQKTHKTHKTQK